MPDDSYEDVHTYVEVKLRERIGEAARCCTARSRNDQVNTDAEAVRPRAAASKLAQTLRQLMDTIRAKHKHPMPHARLHPPAARPRPLPSSTG